jgi:hypothetical protein
VRAPLLLALLAVSCGDDQHAMPDAPPCGAWSVYAAGDTTDGALTCVFTAGAEMFVTGGKDLAGLGGGGVVLHYDGQTWTRHATTQFMWWTFGFSRSDVWAVGQGGQALHWDGSGWTDVPSGFGGSLSGVWGAAYDDVWAVGATAAAPPVPTILHWDGFQWTSVATGTTDTGALFKVWGVDRTHVFVVGDKGIVLQFDGTTWAQAPRATSGQLITDCGAAANDVWAVGGTENAAVLHYDGAQWTPLGDTALLPPLLGCTVASDGRLLVVGRQGFLGCRAPGGGGWEIVDPMPTADCLHNVAPYAGGFVAVGGNLLAPASGLHGVMLRSGSALGGQLNP